MEAIIILALLILPLLALVGAIVGFVALSRARRLDRRLAELERIVVTAGTSSVLHRLRQLEQGSRRPESAPARSEAPPEHAEAPGAESETTETVATSLAHAVTPQVSGGTFEASETIGEETAIDSELVPSPSSPPAAPPRPVTEDHDEAAQPPTPPTTPPVIQRINWEQWIGVRGAAVLGGIALAIAALLFFQYSIEHGLISPTLRVILGTAVGVACITGSGWLHRRQQEAAANALAGAGAVVLYAAIWSARILYHLIPAPVAFVLMALVTVVCGLLAARRSSLVVAVLGLVGGFATPLLVGANADQPIALFSYVLLLDAGLLWLARERRWAVLAVLSLAGTALHQALWFFTTMHTAAAILGLGILAVFGVVFMLFGHRATRESPLWRLTRSAALVLPLAFSLQIAVKADLGTHLAPVGALLILLSACACWLSLRGQGHGLELMAASFSVGVVAVWFLNHRVRGPLAWEAVIVCAALALVFQIAAEWRMRWAPNDRPSAALVVVCDSVLVMLIIAAVATSRTTLWPWLVGWLAQSALLMRHSVRPGRAALQVNAGVAPVLGLFVMAVDRLSSAQFPSPSLYLALVVAIAIALQVAAVIRGNPSRRRWANHAAAATALCGMLPAILYFDQRQVSPLLPMTITLLLAILAALATTRLARGGWLAATIVTTAAVHSLWTVIFWDQWQMENPPVAVFLLQLITVGVLSFWPSLSGRALASSRMAWLSAALAAPLWFFSLKLQWTSIFGDDFIALLPLGLGGLTLSVALRARRQGPDTLPVRRTALAWLLAISLCFVSLAIPLQLDKEWITIGWAMNGLAVLALWRWLDHSGLKYFGLALLGAATLRLVVNPEVLGYHAMGSLKVVNWLLYTYLVPAACLIASAVLLTRHEVDRLREPELRFFRGPRAVGAGLCSLAAIAVVFVWINLCIADIFSTSSQLSLNFDRLPARDLSTSFAWAVYALVLLTLGIRGKSIVLRWLSLGLMLATIVKVFLHDLGELQDLYRVASLLGLAISLILVSLAYQRFVLRNHPTEDP